MGIVNIANESILIRILLKGNGMKMDGKYKCVCEACLQATKFKASENDLHFFVGSNPANFKCDLEDFEDDLCFESVIHWDVGFVDQARYFIYRDDEANMIAWYDTANEIGFKEEV